MGNVASYTEGVGSRSGEFPYPVGIEPAGGDDPDMTVPGKVEAIPYFPDKVRRHPSPFAGRVQPDSGEPVAQGFCNPEGFLRFVLEGVTRTILWSPDGMTAS